MPYRNPDKQRAYKREWARMQRAGEGGTPGGTLTIPFRLRTAWDILELLQEQVDAVRNDTEARSLEKARCIGYLAGIALGAVVGEPGFGAAYGAAAGGTTGVFAGAGAGVVEQVRVIRTCLRGRGHPVLN